MISGNVYFIVFFALAVGSWLFLRNRTPAFKRRWYHKMVYFNTIVIGLLIVAIFKFESWSDFLFVFFIVGLPIGLIAYLHSKTRICHSCGSVTQGQPPFFRPADYCPKCGADLRPENELAAGNSN
jgi:hypothetical protein